MFTSWNVEYWRRVHQPNIHTLQVMMLECRDGKHTDTYMSRAEYILIRDASWLVIEIRIPIISVRERSVTFISFYLFKLIAFMNKRLTLTPIANFASRHLQLWSSPGCVQPCTVHHCFFRLELNVDKPHQPLGSKLILRCRDFLVSNTGEHRFECYTINFSWLLSTRSLRRWKSAAQGRRYDKWINGSDIRFTHRSLPETTYISNALHTHVPDMAPGHTTTCDTVY